MIGGPTKVDERSEGSSGKALDHETLMRRGQTFTYMFFFRSHAQNIRILETIVYTSYVDATIDYSSVYIYICMPVCSCADSRMWNSLSLGREGAVVRESSFVFELVCIIIDRSADSSVALRNKRRYVLCCCHPLVLLSLHVIT